MQVWNCVDTSISCFEGLLENSAVHSSKAACKISSVEVPWWHLFKSNQGLSN